MRIMTLILMTVLVGTSGQATGSTWDDIAAIEAKKAARYTVPETVKTTPVAHWYTLRDGQRVNLANWTLVLFLQSACSYCKQFDPVLAQYSKDTGLSISPFSLDGKGDASFPNVMQATPEVMVEFFGNGLPIATPTTFLVNVNTMSTFPLLQGAVDRQGLASRIDDVLRIALSKGEM